MENNALMQEIQEAREKIQNCSIAFSLNNITSEKINRVKNQLLSADRALNAIQREYSTDILLEYVNKIQSQIDFFQIYAFNNENGMEIHYLGHNLLEAKGSYIERLNVIEKHINKVENIIIELSIKAKSIMSTIKDYFKENGFGFTYSIPCNGKEITCKLSYELIEDTFTLDILNLLSLSNDEIIEICKEHTPSIDIIKVKNKNLEAKKLLKSKISKIHKLELNIDQMEQLTEQLQSLINDYI